MEEDYLFGVYSLLVNTVCNLDVGYRGAGVAQWQFSDDAEQEIWDVLGSNPALHP